MDERRKILERLCYETEEWIGLKEDRIKKAEGALDKLGKLPKMERRKLAILLHNTYEALSKEVGWKTQEVCQVPFEELPDRNKYVMLKLADAILGTKGDWVWH